MHYTPPSRPYLDVHNHIGRTINRAPTVGQNTAMSLARFAQTRIHAALAMSTATGSPIVNGTADIRAHNETIARAMRDHPAVFPMGLALAEVRHAVERLPPEQRMTLMLVTVEGLSYKEAAAVLDIPIGTVMSRLHRGRRGLQKRLWEFATREGLISQGAEGQG